VSNQETYYNLLGLHPSASAIEIRRAYRELSKRYHPDTTDLPQALATLKFQQLNEAYATLSHPERRLSYDYQIGYARVSVIQDPASVGNLPNTHNSRPDRYRSSAYLDPTDRPLSSGEIFALCLMIVSFVGCLGLAIAIGKLRGEL
jgi:curved DNA-binding protein CbpA